MKTTTSPKNAMSMNILVVEDNVTDLKLLHSVLKGAGHKVRNAVSAEQAVQILQDDLPQVILTDLDLPEMDGITMTRQLKQSPKTAGIPIIAITAYPDNFSRRSALEAGVAAYFVKPTNTRTLSHQLASVLNQA